MAIQTVIVEYYWYGPDSHGQQVYFLEESVEEVKASIESEPDNQCGYIFSTVYSLEEYMQQRTRPLSDFCKKQSKGIWWLVVNTEECFNLVTEHIPGWYGLESVQHSHVTLAFNVTEEECPATVYCNKFADGKKIGEYTPVNVRGIAYNSKCAALVVDIGSTECCNKHPHITLATAEEVPPVYSNDMLEGKDGAYSFLPLEATLEGTLEFFEFSDD